VDFDQPTEEETLLLKDFFHFHPLAIEDCLFHIQRPKLNYFEDSTFFTFHSLNQTTWKVEEVDCFLGDNFVVSFHKEASESIEKVKEKMLSSKRHVKHEDILHAILNELVDMYFPILYQIEDKLNAYEENVQNVSEKKIIEEIYKTRGDLIKLRKTVIPMRDLLYRITNSTSIKISKDYQHYFADIYDHLLKLTDILVANQEMTAEMRDNYLSIQSSRMNSIMMTLTIFATIFMPLTFIVGVYGMNFENIPELHLKNGYYMCLGLMAIIAVGMTLWFKFKGWFKF
jgi:magnesium transporter